MTWGRKALRATVVMVAIGGSLAFALKGCRAGTDARAEGADVRIVTVGPENVAVAESTELSAGPVLAGTIAAETEATIRAEVSGPVVQVLAKQGDRVARGQLLARIDDTSLREALLSAQSAMRSAESAAQLARRDADRMRTLENGGAVSKRDVEATDRALVAAEAGLADARARLTMAGQQAAKARILAPFAGIVSEKQVSAGDVVQPGAAMLTVVDPTVMRLEATVPVLRLDQIAAGMPVSFTISGIDGRRFEGRIDRINPSVDPASRQVRVYVTIPNERGALVSGLYAQGRVAAETRNAITAPFRAVDESGLRPTVSVLRKGRAEVVTVELGLRDEGGERVEIVSGVSAGDTLLLGNAGGIAPGTHVRVLSAAERSPSRER